MTKLRLSLGCGHLGLFSCPTAGITAHFSGPGSLARNAFRVKEPSPPWVFWVENWAWGQISPPRPARPRTLKHQPQLEAWIQNSSCQGTLNSACPHPLWYFCPTKGGGLKALKKKTKKQKTPKKQGREDETLVRLVRCLHTCAGAPVTLLGVLQASKPGASPVKALRLGQRGELSRKRLLNI